MHANVRPFNVLHIISDQHHAGWSGYAGHPQAITPNLDRLAGEGVRFSRAYAQNPICTPSRVSVLSGQYCHNHGYYALSGPTPEKLPSFLHHFKEAGYRTAGIGKLHLPDDPVNWLADTLDLYADCYYPARSDQPVEEAPYARYLKERGLLELEDSSTLWQSLNLEKVGFDARPSKLPFEHNVENWCADRAIGFMEADDERPFCMQVSLPRPHHVLAPDQRFWDRYPDDIELPEAFFHDESHRPPHFQKMREKLRNYSWRYQPGDLGSGLKRAYKGTLACITQVDHAVGRLLDHLEASGLAEQTIVIYHSDHGCYHGLYGVPEKAPGICSEAVCRVPMLWRVPGLTPAGHHCRSLVENIDLCPTLASLCGLDEADWTDGRDITPLLRGEDAEVREVAVTENPWSRSLRWGPWRYVHYPRPLFDPDDVGELYHIDNDPEERRNLYHDPGHADIVHECRRRLLDWLATTQRPVTVHPGWKRDRTPGIELAADGRESNRAGPALRHRKGQLNHL